MESDLIRETLGRLARRAGLELRDKQPHWGDAIQCDGLIHAAHALEIETPVADALAWFRPRLATGPRTSGWIWFWSAEGLPALDLYLHGGDAAMLAYGRSVVEALEAAAAREQSGVIAPHPPAREAWIDIAYFAAPAMARLARIDEDRERAGRALAQLAAHRRHLVDERTGMFFHVAYLDRGGHSPCLWARGNSWFAIAASEVLAEMRAAGMDAGLATKCRAVAEALARQMTAVIALQDEGGLWHTVIDRADSYLETSATAGFALALGRILKAPVPGIDLRRAREAHGGAIAALCARVDADGVFTGVSQQTPPGDFAHYQSIETGAAPFGTGVLLMALAEALEE